MSEWWNQNRTLSHTSHFTIFQAFLASQSPLELFDWASQNFLDSLATEKTSPPALSLNPELPRDESSLVDRA